MFSFHFITVSSAKLGPWFDLTQDYLKRLSPYAKIKWIQVPHVSFSSPAERTKVQAQEADRIRKSISTGSYLIACDEQGQHFTSQAFAGQLTRWSEQERRLLTLVLGGPLGLDPSLLQAANQKLALSTFTLPHDLAQLVLAEQIYRAMTVVHKKVYHY